MFIGLIILVVGVLLLLEALVPDFSVNFGIVWPLILILIAIYQTFKRKKLDLFMGIVLFIGIWFLLLNLGILSDVYTDIFWPIIIILVGISLIFNTFKIRKINKKVSTKGSANYYGIFSGCEERVRTNDFKGTNIYSVFGGVDLDLREAQIREEEIVINVYSIFGGTGLLVPDNKTTNAFKEGNKTIYINCISAFGGTEVK